MCFRIEGGCFSFIRLVSYWLWPLPWEKKCEKRQSRLGMWINIVPFTNMNRRTVAYHHGDEVHVVTGPPIKQQSTLFVLNFKGNSLFNKLNQSKYNFDNSNGTNIHFKLTESANFRVSDVMYGEVLQNNHSLIAIHGIVVLIPRCVWKVRPELSPLCAPYPVVPFQISFSGQHLASEVFYLGHNMI